MAEEKNETKFIYKDYTQEEWMKEGKRLFGEEFLNWKFKCPMCGNIQTPEEFRKFKDNGASPDSARQECIGRYLPKDKVTTAFGDKNKKVKSPCDYASYGLFRIGHNIKLDNGKETVSFPFADSE